MPEPKPGPTGDFPAGRLNDEDEGGVNMQVTSLASGLVRLDFGSPVAWVAMPPAVAVQLAESLMKQARLALLAIANEEPGSPRH